MPPATSGRRGPRSSAGPARRPSNPEPSPGIRARARAPAEGPTPVPVPAYLRMVASSSRFPQYAVLRSCRSARRATARHRDDAEFLGPLDDRQPVEAAELAVEVLAVLVDGAGADPQGAADRVRGQPVGHQPQDLDLAGREAG